MREISANGFKLVGQFDDLPWQHVLFFARDDSPLKRRTATMEGPDRISTGNARPVAVGVALSPFASLPGFWGLKSRRFDNGELKPLKYAKSIYE